MVLIFCNLHQRTRQLGDWQQPSHFTYLQQEFSTQESYTPLQKKGTQQGVLLQEFLIYYIKKNNSFRVKDLLVCLNLGVTLIHPLNLPN